jgi:hypothetical protein
MRNFFVNKRHVKINERKRGSPIQRVRESERE